MLMTDRQTLASVCLTWLSNFNTVQQEDQKVFYFGAYNMEVLPIYCLAPAGILGAIYGSLCFEHRVSHPDTAVWIHLGQAIVFHQLCLKKIK